MIDPSLAIGLVMWVAMYDDLLVWVPWVAAFALRYRNKVAYGDRFQKMQRVGLVWAAALCVFIFVYESPSIATMRYAIAGWIVPFFVYTLYEDWQVLRSLGRPAT